MHTPAASLQSCGHRVSEGGEDEASHQAATAAKAIWIILFHALAFTFSWPAKGWCRKKIRMT